MLRLVTRGLCEPRPNGAGSLPSSHPAVHGCRRAARPGRTAGEAPQVIGDPVSDRFAGHSYPLRSRGPSRQTGLSRLAASARMRRGHLFLKGGRGRPARSVWASPLAMASRKPTVLGDDAGNGAQLNETPRSPAIRPGHPKASPPAGPVRASLGPTFHLFKRDGRGGRRPRTGVRSRTCWSTTLIDFSHPTGLSVSALASP